MFIIEIGRATEIKSGEAANKYRIEFFNSEKTTTSIILIEFTEIGVFYVNNVKFGQI